VIYEDLGDTYHNLSDEEKQRIAEIQKERFVE
jgi:hypothetical protein